MRLYKRKIIRWNRVWQISGHWHKQILYVQILLHKMQKSAFLTKINLHHTQNSSQKWAVCRCFICHTCHNDHPKSQIWDLYTCLCNSWKCRSCDWHQKLELEGVIDSQDSCVNFLNRSIPFFPKEKVSVTSKWQIAHMKW